MLVGFDEYLDCEIHPNFSSQDSATKPERRIKYCYNTKRKKIIKEAKQQHSFSFEQDRRILLGVLKHGPKFDKIAKNFPCTINVVKNRYYKYLRFRWDIVLGRDYLCFNQPHPSQIDEQILEIQKIHHQLDLDESIESILKPFLQKLTSFNLQSKME